MYDFLIKNVLVADGTGRAPYAADVAIEGEKIAAIGDLAGCDAVRVIDGAGRYLTPGFIDVHRHGEAAAFRPGYGKAELAQGLTTVINGNCGLSMVPVACPWSLWPVPTARRSWIIWPLWWAICPPAVTFPP